MGEGDNSEGKSILERELNPLERIHDHNPKYLLTMDFTPLTSHNGIKQINVLDWLLGQNTICKQKFCHIIAICVV